MKSHFCTCGDLDCPHHPAVNPEGTCDACIRKNLRLEEIPSCFFRKIGDPSDLTEFTFESFVKFYLEKRGK